MAKYEHVNDIVADLVERVYGTEDERRTAALEFLNTKAPEGTRTAAAPRAAAPRRRPAAKRKGKTAA